jgi:hypothetical protein
MAMAVKDIPVLTGKNLRNFDNWQKEMEGKKVSKEELDRIRNSKNKFKLLTA